MITESDVAVAQEVAEHAEPVVEPQEETADIEEVAETAEVVVAEPEVVTQPAAPVVAEVAAEVETVAAVEPEITVEHNHATADVYKRQGIICRRERCSKSALASNGVMASGLPTKRRVSCELEFSACNAAGTVTEGPKSPPMTSNARVRRVKVSSPPGLVFPLSLIHI